MSVDVVRCRTCDRHLTALESWRFDHEAGDTPAMRASLEHLAAKGIELGAWVTVYYCVSCSSMTAEFTYPESGCSDG